MGKKQMKKRLYLSGQITGDPEYREKFSAAANTIRRLRGHEWTVLNPVDLPGEPPESARTERQKWAWYLIRDLRALSRCDALAVMPCGLGSCGARVEMLFARGLGISVYLYTDEFLSRGGEMLYILGEEGG